MPFRHDSTGVNPAGGFVPIPDGEYCLKITDASEAVSKSGFNMVVVTLAVIEHPEHEGKTFRHWVVFIPAGQKGDGMSVHFRKCIGVPYGGDDEVDATAWLGKKLRANVFIENRVSNGKTFTGNKIAAVMPYGEDFPEVKANTDVPF